MTLSLMTKKRRSRKRQDKSNAEETDADDANDLSVPDNLRRRSEWFQKRTGRPLTRSQLSSRFTFALSFSRQRLRP
jgi:hypothetical protein